MIDLTLIVAMTVTGMVMCIMLLTQTPEKEETPSCEIKTHYTCDTLDVRSRRCTKLALNEELYLRGGNESCIIYSQSRESGP